MKPFNTRFYITICLICLLIIPLGISIQPAGAIPAGLPDEPQLTTFLGHVGGATEAVDVLGNFAYIGEGHRLAVVDLTTNPPHLEGKTPILYGMVQQIEVVGSYAYVARNDGGLRVINVSNPAAPYEVPHASVGGYGADLEIMGNYAFMTGYDTGLNIIDISNPENPSQAGIYVPQPLDTMDGAGLAVSSDERYVYVSLNPRAGGDAKLQVLDTLVKNQPVEKDTFILSGVAMGGVDVESGIVYVAVGSAGLLILDVSEPDDVRLVRVYDTPGGAQDVMVRNHKAYVLDGGNALLILDVANPATPQELGTYASPGSLSEVEVVGNTGYMADRLYGLRIVNNVTNPVSPTETDPYDPPGADAQAVQVVGNTAYVASLDTGLYLYNVTDPSNPQKLDDTDTPGQAWDVTVDGIYAYVADGEQGLRVIDVSNPNNLPQGAAVLLPGTARRVVVNGNLAYVAAGDAGLRIVDVTNKSAPFETNHVDIPGGVTQDLALSGSYLYVASGSLGLRVFDLTAPTAPVERDSFVPASGEIKGVAVSGNYAYVTGAGLRIVDVSNPLNIVEAGGNDMVGYGSDISVVGDTIYIAEGYFDPDVNVTILKAIDLAFPVVVGMFSGYHNTQGLAVVGDRIYTASHGTNLQIWQFTYSLNTITGRITHTDGSPAPLTWVDIDPGDTVGTLSNGYFGVTDLANGTYSITPSRFGYLFEPLSLTVSLPPHASHQDFTAYSTQMQMNYISGQPGSFFTITGQDFPPSSEFELSANQTWLADVTTTATGVFTAVLDTQGADEGYYFLNIDLPGSAAPYSQETVVFSLGSDDPLHGQEDQGPLVILPADIAVWPIYIPLQAR